MTRSCTSRIARVALLAATCAVLLMALAAGASARSAACSARTSRQARACAQSHRHHNKRSHGKHRSKHSRRKGAAGGIVTHVAPVCEDGSKPAFAAGVASCGDGSEAQCAPNTTPVFTAAGSILYCTPDTLPAEEECGTEDTPACNGSAASTPAAPSCQDGTNADLNLEAVYSCDDGTEPRCGEGFSLSISESGSSLVCEPAAVEES